MSIRVLIAADLRLIREWLAQDFSTAPDVAIVGAAAARTEALRLARHLNPDLLVVDRSMPDSLLAVREILSELPRVRVLAFGVQETEPEIAVCSDAGMHGFIPRDATRATLIESLRHAVRGEFVGSTTVSELLLRHFSSRTAPIVDRELTARQVDIARQLELGRSNKEIAAAIGIEVATVKNHVHSLLRKLNVRRRSEAAAKWRRSGQGAGTNWMARRAG
ncbi:MAG TPA: response regulator transcription factor [Gemmatimonadales bacterium]|jgi:DNA-binding NarL/FixJ family response regulator|nr:response regulator transcription factor [Gemmatimonadales bacterium]